MKKKPHSQRNKHKKQQKKIETHTNNVYVDCVYPLFDWRESICRFNINGYVINVRIRKHKIKLDGMAERCTYSTFISWNVQLCVFTRFFLFGLLLRFDIIKIYLSIYILQYVSLRWFSKVSYNTHTHTNIHCFWDWWYNEINGVAYVIVTPLVAIFNCNELPQMNKRC